VARAVNREAFLIMPLGTPLSCSLAGFAKGLASAAAKRYVAASPPKPKDAFTNDTRRRSKPRATGPDMDIVY
jgi:hypothetical protein